MGARRFVVAVGVVALLASVIGVWTTTADAAPAAGCDTTRSPYRATPGARLSPEVHTTVDTPATPYVRWRGTVPSFDGMPLSVDVTVPCAGTGPRPSVTMLHGFTDDKTVWEETGKGDSAVSRDRPASNSNWNNVWFASRGYLTLNYTARGWKDSCGPTTPGAEAGKVAPRCAPFQYWIHLDDKRWEVRDAQWLTAGLVAGGAADPRRLAITGGSYGGAPTASAALLAGNIMCGADPVPAALGPDPCRGKPDGALAPWATPDGSRRLTWAAAVPMYTFADLLDVLAHNGRASDGSDGAPADGDHTDPVGVPIASTLSGLVAAGGLFGALAPPGTDPGSDVKVQAGLLLAGPPYDTSDPQVAAGIEVSERFRSPITTPPQGRVPIYWVQGLTDALFPAGQALLMRQHLLDADPGYPITLFLADIGHDYAGERQDEWDLAHRRMNAFLDHALRPDRTPAPTPADVTATITRCLDPGAPMRVLRKPDWDALHPRQVTFTSSHRGTTSTAAAGPAGAATDPISTATLPGPKSYKGCRRMQPSKPDPTVATYAFPLRRELVLMGGPVAQVTVSSDGADLPVAVRVWDVAAGGDVQALVTRGVYRTDGRHDGRQRLRFQLAPQGYRFPAGHTLKVEVTANDSPYLLANTAPAEVTVHGLRMEVPVWSPGADRVTPANAVDGTGPGRPALAVGVAALVLLAATIAAVIHRRRRPHGVG